MARSITLYDESGQSHDYQVATLYYDRLAQADQDFITSCVREQDGTNTDIIPGGFQELSSRQSPSMQNLKYYVFADPQITPGAAESTFLDSSMGDLIRPDDNINERIVDFTNWETGERLQVGDSYDLCFKGPVTFATPPATITTSRQYWKRYVSGGKAYYERTNTWNAPTDEFYLNDSLTTLLSTLPSGGFNGNVFGCSLVMSGANEVAFTGNDPSDLAQGYDSKNINLAAYATNEYDRGSAFQGGYSDQYTPNEYGLMSTYYEPGPPQTYSSNRQPVLMLLGSDDDPWDYGGIATEDAKVLHQISVQFVYTEIDDMPYVGLMLMKWHGNELVAMNGTFYPEFFYGVTTGSGGNPDEPDPGEENDGPDADDDEGNVEGDYTIVQSPPGAVNAESGWLPYADLIPDDPGYHVYVLDDINVKRMYGDFWASRLDPEKMASGIVRFGMVPNYFLPIGANLSPPPTVAGGITYASYSFSCPEGSKAWHINERTIMKFPNVWTFNDTNGLNRVYGNYLDFEPYTDITINVPFCGSLSIPPSKCMGGSISVSLTVNVENGDIIAQIHCVSASTIKTSRTKGQGETLQTDYYLVGNCFVDLPIAVTPSVGLQVARDAASAAMKIGTGVTLALLTKQYGNAVLTGIQAAEDIVNISQTARPSASVAGGTVNSNILAPKKCYIEVGRVAELADGKYKKISGTQSFKAKVIGEINGFTRCTQVLRTTLETTSTDDGKVTSNVQELNFKGSATELSEIKRILQEGVVL